MVLLEGKYKNPVRIVGFNTADIAQELRRRCDLQMRDVPSDIQDFVDRHDRMDGQLSLRLA
jgi:hypothetical protein